MLGEEVERNGFKGRVKVGDILKKLPYETNSFDAVISIRTLHHGKIEWIRRCIKEIERILRPNGLVFITVRKRVAKKHIPKEKL